MPDPIPFPKHRRAAPPAAPEQPADTSSPKTVVPAVHPDNVVNLDERRQQPSPIFPIYPFFPWGF